MWKKLSYSFRVSSSRFLKHNKISEVLTWKIKKTLIPELLTLNNKLK